MAIKEHRSKRYLRKNDLAHRYAVHVRSVERYIEQGLVPKPDFYIGRFPRWSEENIEAAERAAMRDRS